MAGQLVHRGPDQDGFHTAQEVGLAIRRLKIIDLDGGRQPYFSEDLQVVAVFNGEIYNFQSLRRQLEEKGHHFNTRTDGEVLVHLYEDFGLDFVDHLNGMFAVALWDARRRRLVLARDRLGIKPLYYGLHQQRLYFGSELKAILAATDFPRQLDLAAVRQYLTFEYVPGPRSIFANIRKLLPGHLLVFEEGHLRTHSYWSVHFQPAPARPVRDWAAELRHLLRESVRRRLISDVPLGIFLSGGLDSSSLTALMCELHPGQVKTFSIGFREESFDESRHFREVARFLGTEHHERILEAATTQAVLEPLLEVLDEPLGDAAIVPTYLLSQFAREHVTVALSGEGADELLGGYPTYWAHQLADGMGWLPRPVLALFRWLVNHLPVSRHYLSLDFKLKRFFSAIDCDRVTRHVNWMGSFPVDTPDLLLTPPEEPVLEPLGRFPLAGTRGTETIQTLDLHGYLADDLLVKLDRATMAVSLEGRVPFLDHTVVEFLAHLPSSLKFRGPDCKLALKQALGPSLPTATVKRAKKGFGIPVADWVRGDLRPLVESHLRPEHLKAQGLFHHQPIQRLVDQHLAGQADHRKPIWTLLMFQLWHQKYA